MGLAKITVTPAANPGPIPGLVSRLSAPMVFPALRMIRMPMTRNVAQATHFITSRKFSNRLSTQPMPRMASRGHRMSPNDTPTANGQAARNPPVRARAVSAIQTGPGVRNNSRMPRA